MRKDRFEQMKMRVGAVGVGICSLERGCSFCVVGDREEGWLSGGEVELVDERVRQDRSGGVE